jgi:nucleotide-binding universal stress UspA family protein
MGLLARDGRLRQRSAGGDLRPPGAGDGTITLVVGFDDSGSARRALTWGANLLRAGRGTLHVVYADRAIIASDLTGFARAGMDEVRDEKAASVAATAAHIAASAGVPHTFERRQESPAKAILMAASIQDAVEPDSTPVIVTGRSRHSTRRIIGSVPVRLLRRSPYPVLTIA